METTVIVVTLNGIVSSVNVMVKNDEASKKFGELMKLHDKNNVTDELIEISLEDGYYDGKDGSLNIVINTALLEFPKSDNTLVTALQTLRMANNCEDYADFCSVKDDVYHSMNDLDTLLNNN